MNNSKVLLLLTSLGLLASCTTPVEVIEPGVETNPGSTETPDTTDTGGTSTDVDIPEDTVSKSFTLKDGDGNAISPTNGRYLISSAGSYTAKGKLEEGQIYINASEAEIELELAGVSISNSSVSPIFVETAAEVAIKVKKETENYIYDNRTTDYSENKDDTVGKSAIWAADGDLKFKGTGSLVVLSVANSGIHGKDNVSIKNVELLVKAVNNGIKGNDKVKIEENPTISIVAGNNGIITSNSDEGSKAQHGYIYIYGGNITINSYGDGIDAAYSIVMDDSVDEDDATVTYSPNVSIYTNKYSTYSVTSVTSSAVRGPGGGGGFPGGGGGGGWSGGSSAEKSDSSAKGMKAANSIEIAGGTYYSHTYDDGIHANNDALENNTTGTGNVTISDNASLSIKASDDGIHADGTLTIEGGEILILDYAENKSTHEALEGNIINMTGGTATVRAGDDGVNASTSINISGGRLDVTVSPNGDTDGIDSNGSITISGGIVITRGPNNQNMSPLDADGSIKINGGTTIIIGYAPTRISTNLTKSQVSNAGLSTGDHTVTVGGTTINYNNAYSYSGKTTVYSVLGSATIK